MRLFGHPLHPMIVTFPIAIFPLLLFLDALHWWLGAEQMWDAALWLSVAGLATTLAAMVPGIADMRPLQDGTRAHRVGLVHAVVGTLILLAFVAAAWVRWSLGPDRLLVAAGVDAAGALLVGVQGWLGGELVYRHHVGVASAEEGAEPASSADPAPAARTRRRGDEGRTE